MRSRFQYLSRKQWTRSKSQFSTVSVKHCLLITSEFSFAPLTGHTFLPEFPTRSTFRRCVTWDKGFLFALPIILCICSIISPREVKALVPDQPVSALLWASHERSTLSEHGLTNLFRVTKQQCSHLELVDISSFVKYVICCWPPSPSALEGLTLNSLLNNTLY